MSVHRVSGRFNANLGGTAEDIKSFVPLWDKRLFLYLKF